MSDIMKKSEEMRASAVHYNCAQSVLVPFAEKAGLDPEAALKLSACFGSGMNMGSVCGAVTGGLMALGLCGAGDRETCQRFCRKIRENHDGMLDCRDLLRVNAEKGGERKPHCDGMVFEAVRTAEEILAEKGPGLLNSSES